MRYDRSYIVRLIAKYLTDGLSPREQAILDEWVEESEVNRQILEEVEDPERFAQILEDYEYIDPEIAWQQLVEREPELLKIGSKDRGNPAGAADAHSGSRVDKTGGTAAGPGSQIDKTGADGRPSGTGWAISRLNRFKAWIENHRRSAMNFSFGLILVLLVVTTFFRLISTGSLNRTPVYVHEPLSPAGYGASIQLAGGPVLELANLALGVIGARGGLHFSKTEEGKVEVVADGGRRGEGGSRAAAAGSRGEGGSRAAADARGAGCAGRELTATLSTPNGAWFTAVLADHTVVSLNAGSTLGLYSCGGNDAREVTLTGEAFFDVAPTKGGAEPFVVHVSDAMNIICLGTRFNVKAYGRGHILTTLDQGRIQLEKNGRILTTLDRGEAAILDDQGVRKIAGWPAAASSWKDGKFDFEQVPVSQILEDLGRWYDAKIVYSDKRPITDTVYSLIGYRMQPLDTLVERLSQDAGFHYKIDAGTVYVWH